MGSHSVNPVFRFATTHDIDSVVANEVAAYQLNWSKQALHNSLDEQYLFYIIDYQETLVGHIILHPIVDECHLLNLCVNPSFQGLGIGKQAMQFWIELAKEKEYRQLLLEVRKSNQRAINLYREHGFAITGMRKGYYPLSDQGREDGLVMCRHLEK